MGFTETSCSSQRGSLGAYLAGIGAEIDMIVTDTPGVCDTNANAFAFAAAYLDKPFFQLDMPPVLKGERYDRYHIDDYRALIAFLEEQTGKRLDEHRLREALMEFQKQEELVAELDEMARIVPNPLPVVIQPLDLRRALSLRRHEALHRRAGVHGEGRSEERRARRVRPERRR